MSEMWNELLIPYRTAELTNEQDAEETSIGKQRALNTNSHVRPKDPSSHCFLCYSPRLLALRYLFG